MPAAATRVPQRYDFFNRADQNAMIRSTLAQAVAELTTRYGSDPAKWRVPVTKHVFLTNNFIGAPQAGTDELLSLPSFMNRGTQNDKVVFSAGGVSMCTSAPPGQSGFVAPDGRKSAHYDDQMTLFKDFGCKSEWLTSSDVDKHLESTRQLAY